MEAIRIVEAGDLKKDRGGFKPGDTVKVMVKVVEGEKERLQAFEGVVIRRRGGGTGASFTVRRISYGVGVERTFPVHSPRIDKIEVLRHGDVRQARLYYLRDKVGKEGRIRERRTKVPTVAVAGVEEEAGDGAEPVAKPARKSRAKATKT